MFHHLQEPSQQEMNSIEPHLSPSFEKPALVSAEMGYGHLRAALPLAEALHVELLHADRPPLADEQEQRRWAQIRRFYDQVSRLSQRSVVGRLLDPFLEVLTSIPRLHPYRDLSGPTLGTRSLFDPSRTRSLGAINGPFSLGTHQALNIRRLKTWM